MRSGEHRLLLRRLSAGLVLVLVGASAGLASRADAAEPTTIVDPVVERDGPDVLVSLSATSAGGVQLPGDAVRLEVAGRTLAPVEVVPVDPTFVAFGVVFVRPKDPRPDAEPSTTESDFVYKGVRAALEDSDAAFAYLTPFGLGHPETAWRRSARDILSSQVANSIQYPETLDVLDAVTSNLQSLAQAPDRVKILLIVTRGGDVSRPDDPRFAAIARTIADAKIKVILVSFPSLEPTDIDRQFIATLARSTGALHIEASRQNVPDVLASLSAHARGVLAFRRFRFPVAGLGPVLGGELPLRLTVDGGRGADLGALSFPARQGLLAAIALPLLALTLGTPLALRSRRRGRWLRFLEEVQDLLEHDASPGDVRGRFERGFEAQRDRFVAMGPTELRTEIENLSPSKFRHLRAPRNVEPLGEIQKILARRSYVPPAGGRGAVPDPKRVAPEPGPERRITMQLVGDLVRNRARYPLAVEIQLASIPDAEIERIVRSSPDELREWLHEEAGSDPDVAGAGAEKHLLLIQETLKEQRRPEAIAWLVGGAGSDLRGKTIQLGKTTAIGWAGDAGVLLPQSPWTFERHAIITREGDAYVIRPLGGPVIVDGRTVEGSEELHDGAKVTFGPATFVFMSEIGRG